MLIFLVLRRRAIRIFAWRTNAVAHPLTDRERENRMLSPSPIEDQNINVLMMQSVCVRIRARMSNGSVDQSLQTDRSTVRPSDPPMLFIGLCEETEDSAIDQSLSCG